MSQRYDDVAVFFQNPFIMILIITEASELPCFVQSKNTLMAQTYLNIPATLYLHTHWNLSRFHVHSLCAYCAQKIRQCMVVACSPYILLLVTSRTTNCRPQAGSNSSNRHCSQEVTPMHGANEQIIFIHHFHLYLHILEPNFIHMQKKVATVATL